MDRVTVSIHTSSTNTSKHLASCLRYVVKITCERVAGFGIGYILPCTHFNLKSTKNVKI